jgi:hypothetical protein
VDPMLIHLIIGLSMQGSDPHQLYLGKTFNRSLAQRIKEDYGDVEKGKRGYKVASIEDGIVFLSCQKEPSDIGHWICSRPRMEVCIRNENELGELPC